MEQGHLRMIYILNRIRNIIFLLYVQNPNNLAMSFFTIFNYNFSSGLDEVVVSKNIQKTPNNCQ